MEIIRYGCTALKGINKKGVIKPDGQGYYTMVVGGLNITNSAGLYYLANTAKQIITSSSSFRRRIEDGSLYGENGHPKPLPGMSEEDYFNRIEEIKESNIIVHYKDIWLEEKGFKDKDGSDAIAIMASLTPAGEKAEVLERSLNNPNENTSFSLRGFTKDVFKHGRVERDMRKIVTFDHVTEPGIFIAKKYNAPSLESFDEHVFTRQSIEKAYASNIRNIGLESATKRFEEALEEFGWKTKTSKPVFFDWE